MNIITLANNRLQALQFGFRVFAKSDAPIDINCRFIRNGVNAGRLDLHIGDRNPPLAQEVMIAQFRFDMADAFYDGQ